MLPNLGLFFHQATTLFQLWIKTTSCGGFITGLRFFDVVVAVA
jgi:nucleoside phosphorylase